jgi:hypothetical protein
MRDMRRGELIPEPSTLAIHEAIANDRDGVAIVRVIVIPQMSLSPFVLPSSRGCAAP